MKALGTLWIGERLSEIELASLHSFVALGHDITVYSYAPITNLPPQIKAGDAAAVMPARAILVYKDKRKPSPALHANLFRYAMIAQTGKVWVDLDILALRPFAFASDHVFGLERPDSVNNAVLGLPPSSPTLADLLRFRPDTRGIAPHITGLRRVKYWIKSLGRGYPIDRWAWGSTGPKALTIYLRQHGEFAQSLPVEAFYPVGVHDHAQLLEPGRLDYGSFGAGTYCIHLWGSRIRDTMRKQHDGRAPAGSLLDLAFRRAGAAGFL
ncbi:MAG: hypothetical protein QM656_17350 [Paracoccaceae bacterium]